MAFKLSLDSLPWHLQLGASAVLSAAGVGAFWYLYAVPARADIDSRTKALKKVQAEIALGRGIARRLPQFQEDVADLEAQLDSLRTQLPEEQDVADLLRRVQGMATESKLTIRGFTPQAVTRKDVHAEWPIGIRVEGTYHDLGAFLERVSRFPRIINVGNIKLTSRENQTAGATVSATCTATAFVLVNQADATADGKAPPASGKAAPTAAASGGHSYLPEGRRDPFVSLLRRGAEPAVASGTKAPGIKGLGAAEVTLRGTIASQGEFVAIVQGADSRTYIVRPGERLADGTIRAITADALVILQQVNDPLSLEKPREVRKVLPRTEEGRQ